MTRRFRRRTLLAGLGGAGAAVAAAPTSAGSDGSDADRAPTSPGPWPSFHGGPANRGWGDAVEGPDDGTEAWRLESGGTVTAAPAVVGDTLYAAGWNNQVYAVDPASGGPLEAFDAATGEVRWRFDTDEDNPAPPAVAGGLVYTATRNGTVYAVDVETGEAVGSASPGRDV
jgi:glucose dehydrogenase